MAFRQSTRAPRNYVLEQEDLGTSPSHSRFVDRITKEERDSALHAPKARSNSGPRVPQQQVFDHSPLSDFGSLNTVSHSDADANELSDVVEDAADELDSLDDGLYAFRDPPLRPLAKHSERSVSAILPAHDGLGKFSPSRTPLEGEHRSARGQIQTADSKGGHQASWPRTGPSQLVSNQSVQDSGWLDGSRLERIEKWRAEQTRHLLIEVEQEWSATETQRDRTDNLRDNRPEKEITRTDGRFSALWQLFTRHLLQDLMGVDDPMLCIIFGEDFLFEDEPRGPCLQNVSENHINSRNSRSTVSGVESLGIQQLKRVKRDLYKLSQQSQCDVCAVPNLDVSIQDYAGMPIDWLSKRHLGRETRVSDMSEMVAPGFAPTLGLSKRRSSKEAFDSAKDVQSFKCKGRHRSHETENWAHVSPLRNIFRFLYQRFLARGLALKGEHPSNPATPEDVQSLHRAAIIQQHHPLVSPSRQTKLQLDRAAKARLVSQSSSQHPSATNLKRPQSSCATWSSKRSRRNTSDGGSRNYWDLGGSIGTGSAVFAGAGAWGDL